MTSFWKISPQARRSLLAIHMGFALLPLAKAQSAAELAQGVLYRGRGCALVPVPQVYVEREEHRIYAEAYLELKGRCFIVLRDTLIQTEAGPYVGRFSIVSNCNGKWMLQGTKPYTDAG